MRDAAPREIVTASPQNGAAGFPRAGGGVRVAQPSPAAAGTPALPVVPPTLERGPRSSLSPLSDRVAVAGEAAPAPGKAPRPSAIGMNLREPGAASSPAGSARRAADPALPAGSRSWRLELPAGMKLLSLNDRFHWRERNRRAQAIKDAAIVMARKLKIPPLERAVIIAEYLPPDKRHRDPDNISPAAKAAIDGLVTAKVLPGDDKRYVSGFACTIGAQVPKGMLVLHIVEQPGGTSAGAI